MRRALLVLASGCVSVDDDVGPWRDVAAITGALAPEVGPAIAPRAAGETLRIASWNLHFGADPVGLAAALAADPTLAAADVLFTQEIEAYPDEDGTRASRLAAALGMTWVYAPGRIEGTGTHGIAIFSRYPIVSAEVRDLPHFHMPIGEEPRIALAATLDLGTRLARVVDIHLDVRLGASDRIRQLDPAVPLGDDATIALGGDLNAAPWSWIAGEVPLLGPEAILGQEVPRIVDDYLRPLGWTGAVDPGAATLTQLPVRADNLYARHELAGGVERIDGSDHYPLWIDVSLATSDP